jgi:hypothetical protein
MYMDVRSASLRVSKMSANNTVWKHKHLGAKCEICGSCSGTVEDSVILECQTVPLGNQLLTFCTIIMPHISEDLNLQLGIHTAGNVSWILKLQYLRWNTTSFGFLCRRYSTFTIQGSPSTTGLAATF